MTAVGRNRLLAKVRERGFATHSEVDDLLTNAANRSFETHVVRLVTDLRGVELRSDGPLAPAAGRDATGFEFLLKGIPRSEPLATYIREISTIPRMERDDEVRLARRLEFVRRRFHKALLAAGIGIRAARDILESSRAGALIEQADGVFGAVPTDPRAQDDVRRACAEYLVVRAEFIERNLHVGVTAAAAYRTYGVPVLDLIQEGNAGLIRAVEKFDWQKNVRFRTYATFWIRQAIERAIASSKGIVRVPNYLQQKMRRLRREGQIPRRNEETSLREVSKAFDLSPQVVGHLLETERATRSLDVGTNGDSDDPLGASLPAEERAPVIHDWERPLLHRRIREVLGLLTDSERIILEHRYGLGTRSPKTLEEVGRLMNVSRERVRQLQVRALGKLKASNSIAKLAGFV